MKISVIVHPNSNKPRVEKDTSGVLHVYVHEPPLEGRANKAAIESLAQHFRTKKVNIILLSGTKSKNKLFLINA